MSAKKRNLVAITLVLILAIILLAPLINGWMLKHKYRELLHGLAEDLQLNIEVLNYHQGWFTSDAVIKVTPISVTGGAPSPLSNIAIMMKSKIIHGPLIYDGENNNFRIGCALLRSDFVLHEEPKILLKDSTLVTFAGNLDGKFHVSPVTFVVPFVGEAVWQGIQGDNKVIMKNNHIISIKTDINLNPLTFNSEVASLKISNFLINTAANYHPEFGLWDITNTHRLAFIDGKFKNEEMHLKDFQFDISTNLIQKEYSIDLSAAVKQLVIPNLTLNPSSVKFSFKNLDAKSIQQINKEGATPDEIKRFYLTAFTSKSAMDANINIKTNQGDLYFDWNVSWPVNTPVFMDYESLLASIKMTLKLNVSNSLMQFYLNLLSNDLPPPSGAFANPKIPAQTVSQRQMISMGIQELLQKGVLILDNNQYIMNVIYEKDILKINNKAWPLKAKSIVDEIEKAQQQRMQ